MRICLIRHGKTAANEKRLYCGATDEPLSPAGLEALKAQAVSRFYPDISGMRIYTSGLRRTEETLAAIYGDIPHSCLPGMREMDFGKFEMHSYEELKEISEYIEWITDATGGYVCPGGESSNLFKERVFAAFDGLVASGGDAMVVCHGGVIAEIMARTFPDEGRNFYEWQPSAGCGYEISFEGGMAVGYKPIPQ